MKGIVTVPDSSWLHIVSFNPFNPFNPFNLLLTPRVWIAVVLCWVISDSGIHSAQELEDSCSIAMHFWISCTSKLNGLRLRPKIWEDYLLWYGCIYCCIYHMMEIFFGRISLVGRDSSFLIKISTPFTPLFCFWESLPMIHGTKWPALTKLMCFKWFGSHDEIDFQF